MREIQLTKGQLAQVDDLKFEWLNQWKWYAKWSKQGKCYYAVRSENFKRDDGIRSSRTILMHRQILGLEHGDPLTGDHRNPKDTLNNQMSNLRIADEEEQQFNKGMYANNTSGFKGVSKLPGNCGYMAKIRFQGKQKYLGTRSTPEEASALYWAAAQELHGEFARIA